MKTTLDIIQLANLGVDLIVDASTKTTMDLLNIINAVNDAGGHILLRNCDKKTTSDLILVCMNNPKSVIVDLS